MIMAIKDAKARKTFHWEDQTKGENLLYRIPENIYWNDNVVVREDEWAVFFRDGKALAVFDRPGRFAITTQNLPVLASNWVRYIMCSAARCAVSSALLSH
jgi:membrane protease subunit (stomatin/prohibitin family)